MTIDENPLALPTMMDLWTEDKSDVFTEMALEQNH